VGCEKDFVGWEKGHVHGGSVDLKKVGWLCQGESPNRGQSNCEGLWGGCC